MTEEYAMRSTSRQSATVSQKVLSRTETTQLVVKSKIVENPREPEAGVGIALVHERKSKTQSWTDPWQGTLINLATLKAGEGVRLRLDCSTTLALYKQLRNLYAIARQMGVRGGHTHITVAEQTTEERSVLEDPARAKAMSRLLAQHLPEQVWKALAQAKPDVISTLSHHTIYSEREQALKEFEAAIRSDKNEGYWQNFFSRNKWVFGYGLDYRILSSVRDQPNYGGADVTGRGAQKGDFLLHTEGHVKFTVLVEIKRPGTPLLGPGPYRSGAWKLGAELVAGISQLQADRRQWETQGSTSEKSREALNSRAIYTIQPKGILVIGDTSQLDAIKQRNTFELFRRNIVNPEIITYDELLERAKFIVGEEDEQPPSAGLPKAPQKPSAPSVDDFPF